jgi:hypothetical protein
MEVKMGWNWICPICLWWVKNGGVWFGIVCLIKYLKKRPVRNYWRGMNSSDLDFLTYSTKSRPLGVDVTRLAWQKNDIIKK